MTKAELLEKIRVERSRLDDALRQIRPDQTILYDRWTVKDLLVHIGFWEERAHKLIKTLLSGESPVSTYAETLDELNERILRENRDRPLDDVQRWEQSAYEDMLALVESTSEDDLFRPDRFAWTKGRPLVDYIAGDTYEHYAEHLEALQ